MSEEESNEVPVEVNSEDESTNSSETKEFNEKTDGLPLQIETEKEPELTIEELKTLLSQEKEKTTKFELK
ncbi:MAG: hypothetical protein ACE5EJ_04515, partial [Nitrosopumilaceae archaeon]